MGTWFTISMTKNDYRNEAIRFGQHKANVSGEPAYMAEMRNGIFRFIPADIAARCEAEGLIVTTIHPA